MLAFPRASRPAFIKGVIHLKPSGVVLVRVGHKKKSRYMYVYILYRGYPVQARLLLTSFEASFLKHENAATVDVNLFRRAF